ncbi:MAG TPA: DUF4192 domain-containing protein [Mycobacteriales bacterium]|nr:DUF4192 domain-containing protein [Mycobacteriales bacterium]
MSGPAVRLRTPHELARALPMLLGYQPTESLVVACLQGGQAALGLTLRFDLNSLGPLSVAVEEIAARAVRADADAVLVAVYTDCGFAAGELPFTELVAELFDHPDLWVSDALLIHHGRLWSYLCSGAGCCPADGVPLAGTTEGLTALESSLVLSGSAVLADRSELVASVAVEPTADSPAQRRRMSRARARVAEMAPDRRRRELDQLTDRLTRRRQDPRGEVRDAEAALFAALCGDIGARDDLLLAAGSPQRLAELLSLLRTVVRRVPPPHDAAICTVLAWFAYASGDGTLANIALDRALSSDPTYSLAQLIEAGLDHQLPPRMIQEVVDGAARDIAARDAAG